MLAALGMKTSVDADAFLDCARKVEALGAATPTPSPDVLSRASLLTNHLLEHFGALTADGDGDGGVAAAAFCASLRTIRFVPAHSPKDGVGPYEGELALARFDSLALHADRQLLWSQVPLLRREATPPRSHWSALGLRHPPPGEVVLAHVRSLACSPPDVWAYESEPIDEVRGRGPPTFIRSASPSSALP